MFKNRTQCGQTSGTRSRCDPHEGSATHCQPEDRRDHAAEERQRKVHCGCGQTDLGADESFVSRKLLRLCTTEVTLPNEDLVSPRSDPADKQLAGNRMRRYHGLRRGILILNVDGEALDEEMECELEDNERVKEQDVDMSKEDRAKQDLVEETSNATVGRNRARQDEDGRHSMRQRLPSVATSHFKPQRAEVLTYWDHVNGGELSAGEVQTARRLEVEYLNKMKVTERVPHSLTRARTGKEPIEAGWVDVVNSSGCGNSSMGSCCMVWTRGTREKFRYRDAAHTDISRAYVHSLSKEEKYVELPLGMWTGGSPEYGRLMVSLCGTRGPAAILEDACAQVLDQFEGEVACPCSLKSREGGIRVVVHGDDPLSGGHRYQLEWMKSITNKHFESKHIMMRPSSDLGKSLVMLNRKIV